MMAAMQTTELRGELKLNESMQRYNSWRVGGHAERLYIPADLADLQQFLAGLPAHEPRYVLGLGSNLLVLDEGIK
ncbi:MAG: UDP-N-acetylenolpyruvoylglucosamine reductase, partial [Methylophilaceae bacterium]